jgi:hypothetical protein
MGIWTVPYEIHQECREIRVAASAYSRFAKFTLVLEPTLKELPVRFVNRLPLDHEGQQWVAVVKEGIDEFIQMRQRDDRPIGCLTISLMDLTVHLIDSQGIAYRVAAKNGLKAAFELYGVEVEL